MRNLKLISTAALAIACVTSAHAGTLLTSDHVYGGPGLDLTKYANGHYNFMFGPAMVDQYIFTAAPGGSGGFPFGGNSGLGSVIGQGGYGLASNGGFSGDAVYLGLDSGTGYAKLMLRDGLPVSQLGFFMNYAPWVGEDATIAALDMLGNPFESFDIAKLAPIVTPNAANASAFRGISDKTADIYGLQISGNYIILSGTDKGQGVCAAVPEPASWAMIIAGFGMIGAAMRRRRVQVAYA